MSKNKAISFDSIVNDILDNPEFLNLKKEVHHGISRYEHSLSVARKTYNISRKMKKTDYVKATRAALLHDFFKNCEVSEYNAIKRYKIHPSLAYEHSSKYYNLSELEKDAILSHMFPWNLKLPKYKESWIVTIADKIVATKEGFAMKLAFPMSVFILFVINMIIVSK